MSLPQPQVPETAAPATGPFVSPGTAQRLGEIRELRRLAELPMEDPLEAVGASRRALARVFAGLERQGSGAGSAGAEADATASAAASGGPGGSVSAGARGADASGGRVGGVGEVSGTPSATASLKAWMQRSAAAEARGGEGSGAAARGACAECPRGGARGGGETGR
jgi:hypothetical protein